MAEATARRNCAVLENGSAKEGGGKGGGSTVLLSGKIRVFTAAKAISLGARGQIFSFLSIARQHQSYFFAGVVAPRHGGGKTYDSLPPAPDVFAAWLMVSAIRSKDRPRSYLYKRVQ